MTDERSADTGPACPICDARDCRIYLDAPDEPLHADAIGQSRVHQRPGRILRCGVCGHGFRATMPSAQALAAMYAAQDVEAYLAEVPGRRRTAGEHWRLVRELVSRGRLLDIGCASGLFLERVGDAGWRATGIEPSEELCRDARERVAAGVQIKRGTLETVELESEAYDVVTLWDVLEHAPDPRSFLARAAAPLKVGGYLVLNVPHIESAMARMLAGRWPLLLPEHLHYFSRESLRACAQEAGLSFDRFDQRLAYFSVGHVFERLAEHEVPLAHAVAALGRAVNLDRLIVPVPLGEIVAVFRKTS